MKVLLFHQGDAGNGGGQMQMLRLQAGLRAAGAEVRILCRDLTRPDSVTFPRNVRLERAIQRVTWRLGWSDIHCVSAFDLPKLEWFQWADVVDLHSLHSDYLSYLALPRLSAAKPTVFTFHDMWPITGHCHNSLDCTRWRTGCGRCPYLDIQPCIRRDGTAVNWRLKRWAFGRSRFIIITPSRWLFDLTRQSMLAGKPAVHIPHGIDTSLYHPMDKQFCRELLGVPPGKKVLLFAVDHLNRPLKGCDLLVQALGRLPEPIRRDTTLLLLGNSGHVITGSLGMHAIDLGYLGNDRLKVLAFSAADLFLHPTRADNFPLVVIESMACGTPVVSFRVGGVPEIVREGESGALAEPEDAVGLGRRIAELLANEELRIRLSRRCREMIVKEYSLELFTNRYLEVYQRAIDGSR